jgi:hypothetical protein
MTEKYASNEINIRKAVEQDITAIGKLLLEVHKVHSDARPDLFRKNSRKYTDDELKAILKDNARPVFVVWADNKKALKFYESLNLKIQKIGMEKIL